jgi:hypothetical protein
MTRQQIKLETVEFILTETIAKMEGKPTGNLINKGYELYKDIEMDDKLFLLKLEENRRLTELRNSLFNENNTNNETKAIHLEIAKVSYLLERLGEV